MHNGQSSGVLHTHTQGEPCRGRVNRLRLLQYALWQDWALCLVTSERGRTNGCRSKEHGPTLGDKTWAVILGNDLACSERNRMFYCASKAKLGGGSTPAGQPTGIWRAEGMQRDWLGWKLYLGIGGVVFVWIPSTAEIPSPSFESCGSNAHHCQDVPVRNRWGEGCKGGLWPASWGQQDEDEKAEMNGLPVHHLLGRSTEKIEASARGRLGGEVTRHGVFAGPVA